MALQEKEQLELVMRLRIFNLRKILITSHLLTNFEHPLTEFTNLLSPNDFKKNDDIILNYFMTNL